jgi:hypothetical protein
LGNMLLLAKDELARASFADKKIHYSASSHPLAYKVAEYAEWNQQTVNDYQKWLAEQAVNTWKVGYE